MLIKDMTDEQRKDAAQLAYGYQDQAQRARKADAQGDEAEAQRYIESAQRFARDLWDRYAISVEDHRDAIRTLLGGPDRVVVPIFHDMVGRGEYRPYLVEQATEIDEYNVVGVPVLPAVLRRWEEVRKDWEHVQAEMKVAWDAAFELGADHERALELVADFTYREELKEIRAKEAAQEAEWDKEYGPREWAVTTFQVKLTKHTKETRGRIHRQDCASLIKVWDNGPYDAVHVVSHRTHETKLLRKHDAIKVLREGTQGMRTIVVCQRCAKDLEAERS